MMHSHQISVKHITLLIDIIIFVRLSVSNKVFFVLRLNVFIA